MPAERTPEAETPPQVEWKPLNDPEGALRAAQKKLESQDWLVYFYPWSTSKENFFEHLLLDGCEISVPDLDSLFQLVHFFVE